MADFGHPMGGGSRRGGKYTSRAQGRSVASTGLMLTSMLDILVTILFFLMKNFSDTVTSYSVAKDIVLPNSSAIVAPPNSSLQLVVTKNSIILDEKELVSIVNGDVDKAELYRDGVTIVKLAQALQAHKKRSLYVEQRNDQHSFTGTIVLEADKTLNFKLLKKVLYTAGITDFVNLKLAVLKKES